MNTTANKHTKREKILDHGVQMLMTQGYHGTGLQQILDEVKIPKGSFYNYFKSKEQFAADAIVHYIEPFIIRLQTHIDNPQLNGLQALQGYYQELIHEISASDYTGGCLLGNLMGEIGETSELCRSALKNTVDRYRNLQKQALFLAQSEGIVRRDYTAEAMADLLLNGWQGALLRAKIEHSPKALHACIDSLLNDFFRHPDRKTAT